MGNNRTSLRATVASADTDTGLKIKNIDGRPGDDRR